MLANRALTCVIVIFLVCAPFQDLHARRKDTINEKVDYKSSFIVLAGGMATMGLFYLIYNKLSRQQPGAHKPSRTTNNRNLLVSGNFGTRFFIAGDDAGRLAPGTPIGLSLRYQWGKSTQKISSLGLSYRTAEHDGRESVEGINFKMTKVVLTFGGGKRSHKATWDWDFGVGLMFSQYYDQGVRENGGALILLNVGTDLGIRVSERITVGPRIEWSDWTYSSDTFGAEWSDLISTEILLQGTFILF